MAAVLLGAGVLAYEQVKKQRKKKKAKRNDSRFAELEEANSARINQLQQQTCFCQRSDWRGGGCPNHGYVPAPGYTENADEDSNAALTQHSDGLGGGQRDGLPEYEDASALPSDRAGNGATGVRAHPYEYRRGEEEGAFVERNQAPPLMGGDEVRKINEERRKRMKTGRVTNFFLRWTDRGRDKTRLGSAESGELHADG